MSVGRKTNGLKMAERFDRRELIRRLALVGLGAPFTLGSAAASALASPQGAKKAFRGIFAILQTPFNPSDEIDEDDVKREVDFCVRAGAQGLVWPQLFSEFYLLSEEERTRVAEVILRTAAGRASVVIGVQAPSKELAVKFARHAGAHGADAVIALPPFVGSVSLETAADYYRALARAVKLPVFIQNTGGAWGPAMPTSFVVGLARENPQLGYTKEEIPLVPHRLAEYVRSGIMTGIFSGNAGRNLLNELARGSSGTMPACEFTDINVQIYSLAQGGRMDEARVLFEKLLPMINLEETYGVAFAKTVLVRRRVFKTAKLRGVSTPALDDVDENELEAWWKELAPHFKV